MPDRDKSGINTLNMLQTHKMKIATTYFIHDSYVAWKSLAEQKQQLQFDHWLTNGMKYVSDAKVVDIGTDRDHSAVNLDIDIRLPRKQRRETKEETK